MPISRRNFLATTAVAAILPNLSIAQTPMILRALECST
ncbi:MAG: twin-arginine translocation signal domain-containing protein [Paracoccaceae bacterium]